MFCYNYVYSVDSPISHMNYIMCSIFKICQVLGGALSTYKYPLVLLKGLKYFQIS